MGTGCSSEASAVTVRVPTTPPAPVRVLANGGRGLTYNPKIDFRVKQLAEELGEELIHAICFEFYRRVGGDSVMPEFTDVFTTPAAPASELLCWYFIEAWSGGKVNADRHMYTAHRGSHFAFLHSTHRVWSFHLTEQFWQRWFHHFLGAAEHYRALQEKQRSTGKAGSVLLIRPDPTPLCRRMLAKFPREHPHVHGGAAMCPFARRMMHEAAALASAPADEPQAHAAATTPTVLISPPCDIVAHDAAAPACSSGARGQEVAAAAAAAPVAPGACAFGVLTAEHIRVMRYYLHRLREWMDESDLDKFGASVHQFDDVPAAYTKEQEAEAAVAVAVAAADADAGAPPSSDPKESSKPVHVSKAPSLAVPDDSAAVSINPSVASSSSGSSCSSSPVVSPIRPVIVSAVSPNTKYRLYVPPAAPGGFTAAQVAQHNDNAEGQRAWTILDGKIYNVTRFSHPGGARLLHEHVFGQDCSVAFHQAHPNLKAVHTKALEHMYIGKLILE